MRDLRASLSSIRLLIGLLLIGLMAACSGAADTDDAADTDTEDTADAEETTDAEEPADAASTEEAADVPAGPTVDDAGNVTFEGELGTELCETVSAFREASQNFADSEQGSEAERDAVELMGQFIQDLDAQIGEQVPGVVRAAEIVHDEAARFITDGEADQALVEEAGQVLGEVVTGCEGAGLL